MFQCDCPPFDCAGQVKDYLEGKRGAGDVLVGKFDPLVRRVVERVLGPAHQTEWEDARQSIFLHLFSNLDKWDQRCPFCKWLAVVVTRRAIDYLRMAALKSRREPSGTRLSPDEIPDVRSMALSEQNIQLIEEIIARFPEDWQQVWKLSSLGMGREKVALQIGKSVRTIQYWLAEMLEQVRSALDDRW